MYSVTAPHQPAGLLCAVFGWASAPSAWAPQHVGGEIVTLLDGPPIVQWIAANRSVGFVRRLASTHRVAMNGACAVVARENVWVKETKKMVMNPLTGEMEPTGAVLGRSPMWDYRIKVDPWQVFGQVELDVMGQDIVVEHVWAASVTGMNSLGHSGPHGGVRVKLELDMQAQDDQQLDIDGTGTPSAQPAIVRCKNLEPPEYDCKLGCKYTLLNMFESRVSSKVHLETWQQGAKVTIDFGTTAVKISEVWGAQTMDDDAPEASALAAAGKTRWTFRLLPFNHHMPTDRRSCFGFDSTPPFHTLPIISCIPSQPFPPPPPPSAPSPPPAPPPYMVTERSDCFLGGRVTYVTTPGNTPGTLWEVNVHMERWLVGAQLTLNFFGDHLRAHPLRIASFQPSDAILQVAATYHSVVLELRNSPVHEFNIQAYGLSDGLGKIACCCADMPSPPPPPPTPPPNPRPPPEFPRVPPSPVGISESEWGRGIIGATAVSPPAPPPFRNTATQTDKGSTTATAAAAILGLGIAGYLGMRLVSHIKDQARDPRRKLPPLAKGVHLAGGRPMPIPNAEQGTSDEEEATTKLHIEVSPEERCALRISMGSITNMGDLQELVAEVCEEAGYKQLDDLVMAYKRPDGEFATVTRSVTVDMLKESPALRLAPASTSKKSSKGGEKPKKSSSAGKEKKPSRR